MFEKDMMSVVVSVISKCGFLAVLSWFISDSGLKQALDVSSPASSLLI